MNKDLIRQIVNLVAIVATITINILANALPFNGLNTGQISDGFEVYFVPAGYVFAIWGVIYLGWIAFGVYQALPSQRDNPRLRRVGYWFAVSCFANSIWLVFWHYLLFPLTLVAMLTLLASLILIYLTLGIGKTPVSAGERWLVHLPFSIYLGWITVATIANVTNVLDDAGWTGGGIAPEVWAVILLAAACIITTAMIFTRGDAAYALVIVWSAWGIAVKQADAALVAAAARLAVLFVLVVLAAYGVWAWGLPGRKRAPARR
jgi:hypothetical protein